MDGVEKELDTKRELINDMRINMKTLEGDNKRALQQIESLQASMTELERAKNEELRSAEERLDAIQEVSSEPEWGEVAWGESIWHFSDEG